MRDKTAAPDEERLEGGSGEEQEDCPQISAPLYSTWSSPALVQEERDAPGTSWEILLDCTSSGPSSLSIILILLLPVVWVLGIPHLAQHPYGPENARGDCDVGMCERGFVLGSREHDGAGLRFFGLCIFTQPHRCRRRCKAAGRGWNSGAGHREERGTFWVEGGHGPQASACVLCGSKGISNFSHFFQLIHSIVLFLAPLSLPRPTEDS